MISTGCGGCCGSCHCEMFPQALEAGSGCRNITLELVFFLCSSFLLGAERISKSFLVKTRFTELILWTCCFSKAAGGMSGDGDTEQGAGR